jgi:predicted ATPase
MIKTWTLENFKSVADKITLDMAPLTIFAGANSSGKSTVIQSILLIAQTLQSSVHSRSVVLNGHILRLGAFDDVLYDNSPTEQVTIGFELAPGERNGEHSELALGLRTIRVRYYPRELAESFKTFGCQFAFSAEGSVEEKEVLRLQPRLEQCRITVNPRESSRFQVGELLVTKSQLTPDERLAPFALSQADLQKAELDSLQYELTSPTDIELPYPPFLPPSRTGQGGTVLGVSFMHFLPNMVSQAYDKAKELVDGLVSSLSGEFGFYPYHYFADSADYSLVVSDRFRGIVVEELGRIVQSTEAAAQQGEKAQRQAKKVQAAFERLEREFSLDSLQHCLEQLRIKQRRELAETLRQRSGELYETARGGRASPFAIRLIPLPGALDYAVDFIKDYFTQSVKYLGPLRDEPKPVYPLVGATDSKDIGTRGEHTASVLDVHRNTVVDYIPSCQFTLEPLGFAKESATLLDAVLDWLGYMGIASNVQTPDLGKIGHEMKVATTAGGDLHDLIHVGVGVSQVLPIVVLSLLAERDSTLIFEQPELHLHPRVQTRLADFFLSMEILGKQCIVETHSEYLINRLRYRAAVAKDTEVSENVMVYFVEKRGGQSIYRPITINQYGVIEDWPDGFFDENEENAAQVLRAGMEKRKREAHKHD